MVYTVKTWVGNNIETGAFQAFLGFDAESRAADLELIQLLGAGQRFGRADLEARDIELVIAIRTGTIAAGVKALHTMFPVGATGFLVVDIDGVEWRINAGVATADAFFAASGLLFRVELAAANPFWELNAAENETGSSATSPVSLTVPNQGSADVGDAVFTIKPTVNKVAADGRIYRTTIVIANRTPRPLVRYPVCITDDGAGGGWDHAAEVLAGRSLLSGDDVRVYIDHLEVPRYVGSVNPNDWNDADTKMWVSANWEPRKRTTITVATTAASPANGESLLVVTTRGFPSRGAILIEDEVILYTSTTATSFDGITRAGWATTAAIHAINTELIRAEHRIDIVYGWTGAGAGDANAPIALKPIFDLDTSNNQVWDYKDFSDAANPKRPGSWSPVFSERDSFANRIVIDQGSPDAKMEFFYQAGGALAGFPNFNIWGRSFPTGTGSNGAGPNKVTTFDYQLDAEVALIQFGWDGGGKENVLKQLEGAAAAATSDDIDEPFSPLYWLGWYFRSRVTNELPSATLFSIATTPLTVNFFSDNPTGAPWQSWTAHGDGFLTGVAIHAGNTSVGDTVFSVTVSVDSDGDGDPDVQLTVSPATVTHNPATSDWLVAEFGTAIPVQDGLTYFFEAKVDTTANGGKWNRWATLYKEGASSVAGYTFGFKVLSGSLEFQAGVDAIDGHTGKLETQAVYLDDDTPAIPYVAQQARQDTYELAGALDRSAPAPVQTIAVTAILDVADELEVSAATRRVRNITTDEELYHVVTPDDADAWVQLAKDTSSTIRWVETGLGTVQLDVDYRSKRE